MNVAFWGPRWNVRVYCDMFGAKLTRGRSPRLEC